jgi:hypothetical protein
MECLNASSAFCRSLFKTTDFGWQNCLTKFGMTMIHTSGFTIHFAGADLVPDW